jgi:hypothetical protein
MAQRRITSVRQLLRAVERDTEEWGVEIRPWFRGEPLVDKPLLPGVFRPRLDGTYHDENQLVQSFRREAPALVPGVAPARGDVDSWLFLMQHFRVPTRLLDWSEGALIALYFALQEKNPVLWMLNPSGLLRLALNDPTIPDNVFPLTWFRPRKPRINIGTENIRAAWEHGKTPFDLPAPIHPTYVNIRMNAQRSRFTAHGKVPKPMPDLVPNSILKKYILSSRKRADMLRELRTLGIAKASLFPDLEGLAQELGELY